MKRNEVGNENGKKTGIQFKYTAREIESFANDEKKKHKPTGQQKL